ncbi:MAG: tetraacyldisaccharide 4'-kinase [Dethiosulfovibrio sp.]|nr:tetraacyldisaccharide 4'-kinase [Dethiosulfovibrio sp.]
MTELIKSYLAHAKGEDPMSLWVCLAPLGWLASIIVRVRNWAFERGIRRSQEPPLPVISVGNITLGGTNKTPFVEMVTKGLLAMGIESGIVSRGYGGSTEDPVVFISGRASRDRVGDEPLLLSNRLPSVFVAVSRDRMGDIKALKAKGVQVVVADDAFQHRRLGRDVDIVLVDAACPFGNRRLAPGGILREPIDSLKRAHMVVITKVDQVSQDSLSKLEDDLLKVIPKSRLFRSYLRITKWCLWDGKSFKEVPKPTGRNVVAFSAIGSPQSFMDSLAEQKVSVLAERRFKDHHRYCHQDLVSVLELFRSSNAEAVVCTEKDIYNLPSRWRPSFPLLVPFLETEVDESDRFWTCMTRMLRPHIVVASNGYGEDAMASLLAQKLMSRFPASRITGFPLVGRGEQYVQRGVEVGPVLSVTPTGGVVKYRFSDLMTDIKSGLLGHIKRQYQVWNRLKGHIRTPICVGDVYLFLHSLWGQGQSPVLIATAKTTYLHGHWRAERLLLRSRARSVWTRDRETAAELLSSRVPARFDGNPIMDLVGDNRMGGFVWPSGKRVLILPGSRDRAYSDVRLILDSASEMSKKENCCFVAVVAPTLDLKRLVRGCPGWIKDGDVLRNIDGSVEVNLYTGPVADPAEMAQVLIGLGGTANQVCAGLGVPVVSILEKGTLVQQKLLGSAELLVPPTAKDLARAALSVLADEALARSMAEAGKVRLGTSGALDKVVSYCGDELGWTVRDEVYSLMKSACRKGKKGE